MAAHCARVSAMPMLCLLDTHSATSACNIGESVVNMYCANTDVSTKMYAMDAV